MSSNHSLTVGAIGAGNVALAIAGHAVATGHHVILSLALSRGVRPV